MSMKNVGWWAIILFCLIIFGVIVWLGIYVGREKMIIARDASTYWERIRTIQAPRGNITDKNGKALTKNELTYELRWLANIEDLKEEKLQQIATVLGLESSELSQHRYLSRKVTSAVAKRVKENQELVPHVKAFEVPIRVYPYKETASHVIGYVDIGDGEFLKKSAFYPHEIYGHRGIEKMRDANLRGVDGRIELTGKYRAQGIGGPERINAIQGNSLQLTIDIDLQSAIEAIFAEKELSGAVVINEVMTGRMLALVSAPERDLNLRDRPGSEEYDAMVEDPLNPLSNKLTWRYSLGGLYNLIVSFAALDSGIISTTKGIYCPGYQWYNQKVYHCTKHNGHEKVNLKKALAEDCRIFFYELGQQVGSQKMARYASELGFGRKTGIDLSYEQSGRLVTGVGEEIYTGQGATWEKEEFITAILGKKFNLATSIQVSLFTAAIANGGTFYKPAIVEEMRDASGEVLEEFTPEVFSYSEGKTSVFKNLNWAMPQNQIVVGTSDTGEKLKLSYSGLFTSSEPLRKNIAEDSFGNSREKKEGQHAWFTGFTPIIDPQIAVTVLLDNTSDDIGEAEKIVQEVIVEYYRFSQ